MTLWQVVSYIGVIGIIIVAFLNPRGFVINVSNMLITPLLMLLQVLIVAFQRLTEYHFKDGEISITPRLFLILKLRTIILYLVRFIKMTYNTLIGEEMLKITKPDSKVNYVPVDYRDKPTGDQPVFVLKRLPTEEVASKEDSLVGLNNKGRVSSYRIRSTRIKIVQSMLSGWDNIGDDNGNQVPFDPSKKSLMYDLLPREIQKELEDRFGDGSLDFEAAEQKLAEAEAKAKEEEASDADDDAEDA